MQDLEANYGHPGITFCRHKALKMIPLRKIDPKILRRRLQRDRPDLNPQKSTKQRCPQRNPSLNPGDYLLFPYTCSPKAPPTMGQNTTRSSPWSPSLPSQPRPPSASWAALTWLARARVRAKEFGVEGSGVLGPFDHNPICGVPTQDRERLSKIKSAVLRLGPAVGRGFGLSRKGPTPQKMHHDAP